MPGKVRRRGLTPEEQQDRLRSGVEAMRQALDKLDYAYLMLAEVPDYGRVAANLDIARAGVRTVLHVVNNNVYGGNVEEDRSPVKPLGER